MSALSIQDLLATPATGLATLAKELDAMDHARRLALCRAMSGRDQAKLFEAAEGFRPVGLADFVPATTPALVEVIHHGTNSLPVFSTFQKRFCRPSASGSTQLWGYNQQSLMPLTGPGFYVVDAIGKEIVIDYTRLPTEKPAAWPEIRDNARGLSRLVYATMKDTMRGVSEHVSIGRAAKKGKWLDNWFVLCRDA